MLNILSRESIALSPNAKIKSHTICHHLIVQYYAVIKQMDDRIHLFEKVFFGLATTES